MLLIAVCGPCIRRYGPFPTCEWGVRKGRGTAIAKKDEILRLTRRVQELEQEKQSASPSTPVHPELTDDAIAQGPVVTTELAQSPDTHVANEHVAVQHLVEISDNASEHYIESSAMMGFAEHRNQSTSQQYGDASVTSFMKHIKSLVDQETTLSASQGSPASARTAFRRMNVRKMSSRRQLPNYVLPSRQRADHLLSIYCRLVATLYPFLDLDEVKTLYGRLWTGEDLGDDGLTFLSLINVVFSIACNLDSSMTPHERLINAEVFYVRAQELLQADTVQRRSVLAVQRFLLLGQYLQSTNDPEQCWIYVGFAIRIAQSLRLDIPSTSTTEPLQRREAFRRVWYGCILMDQTLSMTFGRPAMITSQAASSVPFPLAHSGVAACKCFAECLSNTSATDFHFFIETLKLYNLMNETILALYNAESDEDLGNDPNYVYFGASSTRTVGNLLELDHKISCWYKSLPIHLRHDPTSRLVSIRHRQSNILYIRYSHVKILLYRPVLARYCSRRETQEFTSRFMEDCLPSKVALQFSVACVKAAFKTIECFDTAMLDRELEDLDEILPAWWYGIFYIYTAATVLVAARLNPILLVEVTERAVLKAWNAVMRILSRYQAFSKHAKRCSTALNLLLDQVKQRQTSEIGGNAGGASTPVSPSEDGEPATLSDGAQTVVTAVHTQDWATTSTDLSRPEKENVLVKDIVRHFNTAGIQVDIFGDMSWLASMPSQLY